VASRRVKTKVVVQQICCQQVCWRCPSRHGNFFGRMDRFVDRLPRFARNDMPGFPIRSGMTRWAGTGWELQKGYMAFGNPACPYERRAALRHIRLRRGLGVVGSLEPVVAEEGKVQGVDAGVGVEVHRGHGVRIGGCRGEGVGVGGGRGLPLGG